MASPKRMVSVRNFNKLPLEIMLEIMSRLPTESVLECKSVCKPWRDIVQHASFSQLHLKHLDGDDFGKLSFISCNRELGKQFYYTEYDENTNSFVRETRVDLRPPLIDCYFLNSCNGDIGSEPAYLCNPITREYILLPKSKSGGKYFLSGFGHSPSTNEYKVVRVSDSKEDPNYGMVQVYTLGSGTGWRNVTKMGHVVAYHHGKFVNGAIHWVDKKQTIFAFNLADEKFHELPSPPCLPRGGKPPVVVLQVSGDFLCAYLRDFAGGSKYWDIWILKKNNNYRDVIWSHEFNMISFIDPIITYTKSGRFLGYDRRDENVYLYASEASSSRTLVNVGKVINIGAPHKNTLVSLKALGEEDTKIMEPSERTRSTRETESSDH